jgi:hypothetical protein
VGEARCREGRMGLCRATVIGAMGWLGLARLARLAGHGLGERETEQRERTEQRSVEGTGVARGGWRGGW